MAPLTVDVDVSLLCSNDESKNTEWDPNASITSELSWEDLNDLKKSDDENDDESWDPESSDFSLDVRLASFEASSDDGSQDFGFSDDEDGDEANLLGGRVRKISFDRSISVIDIPCLDDYTDEEMENIWYDRSEYSVIRNECLDTVEMMEDGLELDEELDYSSRGLEYKTNRMYKLRQRNKRKILEDVLEEQTLQKLYGSRDDEWISKLCARRSRQSVQASQEQAQRDAEIARKYLNERQ